MDKLARKRWQATVEDAPEEPRRPAKAEGTIEFPIQLTLPSGTDPCKTRSTSSEGGSRARMIATAGNTHPVQVRPVAGQRRRGKTPPKMLPPRAAPSPEDHSGPAPQTGRPDLADIRMVRAINFAQYSQSPGTQVFKITWDELDNATKEPKRPTVMPDIDHQDLRPVLLGRGSPVRAKMLFPEEFHDFIDECYHPTRLAKITTADVNKFMEDKPELSRTELLQKLPLGSTISPEPSPHRTQTSYRPAGRGITKSKSSREGNPRTKSHALCRPRNYRSCGSGWTTT